MRSYLAQAASCSIPDFNDFLSNQDVHSPIAVALASAANCSVSELVDYIGVPTGSPLGENLAQVAGVGLKDIEGFLT